MRAAPHGLCLSLRRRPRLGPRAVPCKRRAPSSSLGAPSAAAVPPLRGLPHSPPRLVPLLARLTTRLGLASTAAAAPCAALSAPPTTTAAHAGKHAALAGPCRLLGGAFTLAAPGTILPCLTLRPSRKRRARILRRRRRGVLNTQKRSRRKTRQGNTSEGRSLPFPATTDTHRAPFVRALCLFRVMAREGARSVRTARMVQTHMRQRGSLLLSTLAPCHAVLARLARACLAHSAPHLCLRSLCVGGRALCPAVLAAAAALAAAVGACVRVRVPALAPAAAAARRRAALVAATLAAALAGIIAFAHGVGARRSALKL